MQPIFTTKSGNHHFPAIVLEVWSKKTFFHRFPDFMLRGCWIRQALSIFQPKQHAICCFFFSCSFLMKRSKDILKLLEIIKKTYHYCFRVNYAKLSKIYEGWIETCRAEFLQISFCNIKTCTQNFLFEWLYVKHIVSPYFLNQHYIWNIHSTSLIINFRFQTCRTETCMSDGIWVRFTLPTEPKPLSMFLLYQYW